MKRKFDFQNDEIINKKRKLEDYISKKRKFDFQNDEIINKKRKLEENFTSSNKLQKDQYTQTEVDPEKPQLYNENIILKEMLNNLYVEYQKLKNDYEMRLRKQEYFQNVY